MVVWFTSKALFQSSKGPSPSVRQHCTTDIDVIYTLFTERASEEARDREKFFKELINKAEQGLDEMFLETYGVLYRQNDKIFEDLFKELRLYYNGKDTDLILVMRRFFHQLLVKMFQLINSLEMTEGPYMDCLSRTMEELKPFGDVPNKLSTHVNRAFIAARTFVQGLDVGRDVIANIKEVGAFCLL
ncbi:glypican-6 [Elysia marginata]|uniref:Glypican-6 n=1 Tax=Elysia marginata TaxID=1093978 RepID=A0AAV4J6Q8_9GAST|nr:glypican-6 [Elysia marginata]